MPNIGQIDANFLQVRRVMASIAYENGEIDEQERVLLASSMAGQYQLSEDQLQTLLEDAVRKPAVENLVSLIRDPQFQRLLVIDLMTLAVAKQGWQESEMLAAKRAIEAIGLPRGTVASIRQAFELLLTASGAIQSASAAAGD